MGTAPSSSLLPPPPDQPRGRRLTAITLSIVGIALVGWIDLVTGPDIGLALLYLVPVSGAGWFAGRRGGTVAAVVASVAWLVADAWFRSDAMVLISAINGVTRLGIFLVVALLTATVRTDRRRLEQMLERERALARTDSLTGLSNARAFLSTVRTELARARRGGQTLCICYLDLDNFKNVNDRYGHAGGDTALTRVAQLLRTTLRGTDVAARLGGDEFALLLWDLGAEDAEQLATRLVDGIRRLGAGFEGTGLGASAGVAVFDTPPEDADEAIRRADDAMYRSKSAGKGRVVVVRC